MPAPKPKSAKNTDAYVGARVRGRRILLGMTQTELARSLGISYQQQQKYETAANRISAGRLYNLAGLLGVDVAYFFEGVKPTADPGQLPHGGTSRAAIQFVRNFEQIADKGIRRAVTALVKALAGAKRRRD